MPALSGVKKPYIFAGRKDRRSQIAAVDSAGINVYSQAAATDFWPVIVGRRVAVNDSLALKGRVVPLLGFQELFRPGPKIEILRLIRINLRIDSRVNKDQPLSLTG